MPNNSSDMLPAIMFYLTIAALFDSNRPAVYTIAFLPNQQTIDVG